ncbi:MAG: hypothetical protein ABJN95_12910 [Maribacter sp.]|uniref:hypothetical protein n=1 Tax=Maribacter sp. TaxID=1897614 RepID=UPI003299A4F9
MKSTLFFIFTGLISIFTQAQIKFEPGYFITNEGQKTNCFIKNSDWKNNPIKFDYRMTPEGEIQTGLLRNITEFATESGFKYLGRSVAINRSSNKTAELEGSRVISFQKEKLFLKVLVEGPSNLYYYEQGDLRRFFFSIGNGEIIQLRFKRYLKEPDNNRPSSRSDHLIGENNEFRQQLWNSFNCEGLNKAVIAKLAYKFDPITKLFNAYNVCIDPNYVADEKVKTNFKVNVSLRPGFKLTSLDVDNSFSAFRNVNFDQKLSWRAGVELEAVLPFNKNKWAIIAEPTFNSYTDEAEITVQSSIVQIVANINYKSLELPIGIRHYMFVSDKFKLFLNASALLDIPFNSEITYSNGFSTTAQLGFNTSFVGGIGLNYNNKFSIEGRYLGSREVFSASEFISYISDYKGFSLILGYTIF